MFMVDILHTLQEANGKILGQISSEISERDQIPIQEYVLGTIPLEQTKEQVVTFFEPSCMTLEKPTKSFPLHKSVWHTLEETGIEMYMYSAIYDDRKAGGDAPYVRILAIGSKVKDLYCHLWYPDIIHPLTVKAKIDTNGRGHVVAKHFLGQYFFSCLLPPGSDVIPGHVTVSSNQCGAATNIIPVTVPSRSEAESGSMDFGICVPISFWHVDPYRIIEWVEMNKLFGIDEINVYPCNMSATSMKVLEYLQSQGLLRIFPIPPPQAGHTRDGVKVGSPASINDCLWRNMYRYKYAVIIDFDEIIVPKMTETYREMLDYIDVKHRLRGRHKSYTFRNTYFWVGCPESGDKINENKTYMFKYTAGEKPSQYGHSSKSFISPLTCLSAFNHMCLVDFPSQRRVRPSKYIK